MTDPILRLTHLDGTYTDAPLGGDGIRFIRKDGGFFDVALPAGIATPPATNWSLVDTPLDNLTGTCQFMDICHGEGVYVATATNRLMASTDGEAWELLDMPGSHSWTSVCYGDGLFVALARKVLSTQNQTAATSIDGRNWTLHTMQTGTSGVERICYGNGVFVGVGNKVYSSTDGATWTARLDYSSQYVAYGGGRFVTGNRYSYDGIAWHSVGNFPSGMSTVGIAYGNGRFVLYCGHSSIYGFMVLPDGETSWSPQHRIPGNMQANGSIAFGKGVFVGIGQNYVMVSTDGVVWVIHMTIANGNTSSSNAAYANGRFFARHNSSASRMMTSL